MTMSWDEATAAVTGPGQLFELVDTTVRGMPQKVFKNAPPHLGVVFNNARNFGDRVFMVYEDEQWTFANVVEQVDALANLLVNEYGIRKGDRVAIAMRNYPEWVMSFAAITSIGAISVSMNSWWTTDEMEFALEDSGAKVYICDQQRFDVAAAYCAKHGITTLVVRADNGLPATAQRWEQAVKPGAAHPGADIDPDDDATILYTSGTTGRPKGAVSTHRAILSSIMSFSARQYVLGAYGQPPKGGDLPTSFILIVPLFHVTGCVPVMLASFLAGLKLVIMYKWDADKALQLIEREKVTNFIGVPTQGWDLVNAPNFDKYDTSSLRAVGGGGAPAPATLVSKVANTVKTGSPQLGYGMTETNAFGPGIIGKDYIDRPTSTGRAILPMQVEIRDDAGNVLPAGRSGEIWFYGPMLIRGYWNRPEATAETIVDGWLRSGDLGHLDDEGFLYIEDRVKDMILRGGENVYGAEVENAIYEHPAVYEAAVFGVPHERLGEEVAVAIYPKDKMTITPDELWAFLDGKIANFKVPSQVVIINEPLPRNAAGKFLKRELRDQVVAGTLVPTSR